MNRDESLLRDEIELREASLADAQREVGAGELSAASFATISMREHVAISEAQEKLAALSRQSPEAPKSGRRRRGRLLVLAGLCFAVALGLLLWSSLGPRQAGNSITGSPSLGHAQEIQQLLIEAQADIANGNVVTALSAYEQVLKLDDTNVPALTQTGWLDFSAGSSDQDVAAINLGIKDLRRAVALAPRNPAPRLYYAIVADSTPGNRALAKKEFEIFLALKPSRAQLLVAAPLLKKLGLPSS
jgi:tetratricopeptide (TPR) repeat protein